MTTGDKRKATPGASVADRPDWFGTLALLASKAPTKIPDWFVGKKGEVYQAWRLYEAYRDYKGLLLRPPNEVEEMLDLAGDKAQVSAYHGKVGGSFPYEEELQKERMFQWPWYYASELLKRAELYFPNNEDRRASQPND